MTTGHWFWFHFSGSLIARLGQSQLQPQDEQFGLKSYCLLREGVKNKQKFVHISWEGANPLSTLHCIVFMWILCIISLFWMIKIKEPLNGQTGLNEVTGGQTGSKGYKWGQTGSNRVKQGQTGSNRVKPGQTRSNRVNCVPNGTKWDQTGPNSTKHCQVGWNMGNPGQMVSNGAKQGQLGWPSIGWWVTILALASNPFTDGKKPSMAVVTWY